MEKTVLARYSWNLHLLIWLMNGLSPSLQNFTYEVDALIPILSLVLCVYAFNVMERGNWSSQCAHCLGAAHYCGGLCRADHQNHLGHLLKILISCTNSRANESALHRTGSRFYNLNKSGRWLWWPVKFENHLLRLFPTSSSTIKTYLFLVTSFIIAT